MTYGKFKEDNKKYYECAFLFYLWINGKISLTPAIELYKKCNKTLIK